MTCDLGALLCGEADRSLSVGRRLKFYTILTSCADVIQAVSVDEALVEVTSRVRAHRPDEDEDDGDGFDRAKEVAELVRNEVRAATGCESKLGGFSARGQAPLSMLTLRLISSRFCSLDRHLVKHPPLPARLSQGKACRVVSPPARGGGILPGASFGPRSVGLRQTAL